MVHLPFINRRPDLQVFGLAGGIRHIWSHAVIHVVLLPQLFTARLHTNNTSINRFQVGSLNEGVNRHRQQIVDNSIDRDGRRHRVLPMGFHQ